MSQGKGKKRAVKRFPTVIQGKSLTEQHHAKACDINSIMAKYVKTGVLDHITRYEPTYGDISDLDFKKSMDTVKRVEQEFADLPAFVRDHYDGDASKYLSAVVTEEGLQELRGLKPPGMQYERDGTPSQEAPKEPQTAPEGPEGDTEGVT